MDFEDTLKAILYAFQNILTAAENKIPDYLNYIKLVAKQEIKAVEYDLNALTVDTKKINIKGDKK